jgi:hypothetical protein
MRELRRWGAARAESVPLHQDTELIRQPGGPCVVGDHA